MMRYYLKITLLVDEPIQFTVFSDAARRDAERSLIFENQVFTFDVNSHMLDYFKPEHIGTHLGIAVDVVLPRLKAYKLFSSFCEPFEVVNGETIFITCNDAVVLDAYGPRSTLEFDECDVLGFVQNYIKNVRIERVNY